MRPLALFLLVLAGCAADPPIPAHCEALEPLLAAHREHPLSPRHATEEMARARQSLGPDFEPCLAAEASKDPEVARRLTICLDALAEDDPSLAPAVLRICRVWVRAAERAGGGMDERGNLYTALCVGVLQARRVGDMDTARDFKGRADRLAQGDENFIRGSFPAMTEEDQLLFDSTRGD